MMRSYGFRIRFRLFQAGVLPFDTTERDITAPGSDTRVWIASYGGSIPIKKSDELILRGEFWETQEEAEKQARRFWHCLRYALATLRIGVSFGDWGASGELTKYAISRAEEVSGVRIRNDKHGIQIVPSGEKTAFLRGQNATIIITPKAEQIGEVFHQADFDRDDIPSQLRLSFDLFSASFFLESPDTRLITLVMSVEALLKPEPRSEKAVLHVEQLIALTRESTDLQAEEKDSIEGSLRWIRVESIRQGAKRLISEHLADREYNKERADKFFYRCYDLRSKLVHGESPRPEYRDVSVAAANLEVMASDLLSSVYLAG